MAIQSCSCENPKYPALGRPNCVIEMRAVAFPIAVPRYKADGTRNTIDLTSPTLGDDIKALIQAGTALDQRLYPFPRMENITWERTDTVFETAPSTRKYKIPGVGGVRTFNGELWSKDAVHQILRELQVVGCSEVDVFFVTVDGNLWGILEDQNSTELRGYEIATETFDAFKDYATDTTVQKIMVSFDFDNAEAEECSYGITTEELGYKATTLRGLIAASQAVTELTNTQIQSVISTGFGSAGDLVKVEGLLQANFTVEVNGASIAIVGVTEPTPGTYVIEHAGTVPADEVVVKVLATGYDVADAGFTATL